MGGGGPRAISLMKATPRPLVSVIVAAYNQGQHLEQCLRSLLSQTMPRDEYEIIVVNDGSIDETPSIMAKYQSDVGGFHHESNRGLAEACNTGLNHAKGEYVVRVDSDDWVTADALLTLHKVVSSQMDAEIVLPDYWRIVGAEHLLESPSRENVFTWLAGGSIMRKEAVMAAGCYRPLFWEEYDLYIRMLEQGARVARLPQALLCYRTHPESMTASEGARLDGWRELLRVWPQETLYRWGHDDELERVFRERVSTS